MIISTSLWRALALAALLVSGVTSAAANSVTRLQVKPDPQREAGAEVRISCSKSPIFQVYDAQTPRRVIVEMLDTELTDARLRKLKPVPPIQKIEVERSSSAIGEIARLHLRISQRAIYDVRTENNVIVLKVFHEGGDEGLSAEQVEEDTRRAEVRRIRDGKARAEAEARSAQEARKAEADRRRLAEEAARKAEEEKRRLAQEKQRATEEAAAARAAAKAEKQRLIEEKRRAAEQEARRVAEEKKRRAAELAAREAEAEARHVAEEKRRAEEAAKKAKEEKRRAEEKRLAKEAVKKAAQEKLRLIEEKKRLLEERKRLLEDKRRAEVAARKSEAERRRLAEDKRRAEDTVKKVEVEKGRLLEEKRRAEVEKQLLSVKSEKERRALAAKLEREHRAEVELRQRAERDAVAARKLADERQRALEQERAVARRAPDNPTPGFGGATRAATTGWAPPPPSPPRAAPPAPKPAPTPAPTRPRATPPTPAPTQPRAATPAPRPKTTQAPKIHRGQRFVRVSAASQIDTDSDGFELSYGSEVEPTPINAVDCKVGSKRGRLSITVPGGARYSMKRRDDTTLELTLYDTIMYDLRLLRGLDLRRYSGPIIRVTPEAEGRLRSNVTLAISHVRGAQLSTSEEGDSLVLNFTR